MLAVGAGCVIVHKAFTKAGIQIYTSPLMVSKGKHDAFLSLHVEGSEFDSSGGQNTLTDDG